MFDFLLLLGQDLNPLPDTTGLEGDGNLIWVIGFLIALLTISNGFWVYRDRRLAGEIILERIEWEKKRDDFDEWKEKSHKKMMRLALRVQKALEAWAGIEASDLGDEPEED